MKADLHVHYEYSNERLKDSTNRITDVLGVCKELGISCIAMTDHDILTGHIKFLQEVKEYNKKNQDWPVKPVLGNECYVVDDEKASEGHSAHYPGRIYGHLILLAKNKNGYKQIRALSKIAWTNMFRIGKYIATPVNFSDLKSIMNSQDVICSTACLGSLFAKYVVRMIDAQLEKDVDKVKEYHCKIHQYLTDYKNLFKDDFYIEIQPNRPNTDQWRYNKVAVALAEKYNIPYIITTDAHYLRPEDAKKHEIFLKSDKNDVGREVQGFYDFTYLMSIDEIHALMDENIGKEKVDLAIKNSLDIANKIEVFDMELPTQMPKIDLQENVKFNGIFEKYCGDNWNNFPAIHHFYYGDNIYNKNLIYLIENGLKEKIINNSKKRKKFKRYVEEIEINLDVLWDFEKQGSNFSQYFLVTKKIIDLIWEAGSFVGVARGSSGAFIINYLMDIVDVDAIEAGFPYWRFLAKGRKDDPDIDIDSNPLYKQRILKKLYNFFGLNNVLPISTTGTEGSKSIVLSTFRAYDIDADIAQRISDTIPVDRGKNWPLKDCIFGNADADREAIPLMQKYYKQYKEPLDIAMSLEGLINKRSSHASGILIYPEDYLNYNSMMKAPGGLEVSSYTMEDSQFCGGIKEDLLYTEFESKLQLCHELMRKDGIIEGNNAKELYKLITPSNLNLEDENIWKNIFHAGNVKDVFQMEGATGIDICQKVKPSSISELSAANSLMRLKSDINVEFIASQDGFEVTVTDFMKQLFENEQLSDKFLRYKNNPKEFIDDTINFGLTKEWAEKIYNILQDTYGVCVSQEDLMRLCMELFDFNIAEAHKARKGVAKKKGKLIEECRMLIIERAKEKNIDPIVPFYVWLLIMGTAAYSFSVVHAYSYSLIGYQGAFLKYYYPLYWHTACLTINAQAADIETDDDALEELDETQKKNKTSDYAKLSKAIFDLHQEGVDVACPNINKSEMGFSVDKESQSILYGLKALDGIGDEIAKQIISLRPYNSFEDFLQKNVLFDSNQYPERKKLDKNAILSLIFSNSFKDFGKSNSSLIIIYMSMITSTIEKLNTRYLEELLKLKSLPVEYQGFIEMKKYMPKIKKFQDEDNKKIWKIPKYESLDQSCLIQHIYDYYYSAIENDDGCFIYLTKKIVNQIYKEKETNVKNWMEENEEELKNKLNNVRIKQEFMQWTKGKLGSDLAFKAMGFYPAKSWLDDAAEKYKISEYLKLPKADENIVSYGTYKGSQYPIFKISQIPITVIEKNPKHKTVTGMTKGAIITLKFKTEVYDYYSSYFDRGEKLVVWGYRGNKDDSFTVKLYGSTRKSFPDTHTVIRVQ